MRLKANKKQLQELVGRAKQDGHIIVCSGTPQVIDHVGIPSLFGWIIVEIDDAMTPEELRAMIGHEPIKVTEIF